MRFQDIPQFPVANYEVDVSWSYLENTLTSYAEQGLDLDPDFQRGHVWSLEQQTAFVEHMLLGGKSPRHLYFNCPTFRQGRGLVQLIDGKQRLEAARAFLSNRLAVFGGHHFAEFEDRLPFDVQFRFHIHSLPTRADVLRWYIGFNRGGTAHTEEEMDRVRALLDREVAS